MECVICSKNKPLIYNFSVIFTIIHDDFKIHTHNYDLIFKSLFLFTKCEIKKKKKMENEMQNQNHYLN